jgi:hypothetical protein
MSESYVYLRGARIRFAGSHRRVLRRGGAVVLVYGSGSGQYERIVTADSTGSFTVTQNDLLCGDIQGQPGAGVKVSATNLASGQYATGKYSTPC